MTKIAVLGTGAMGSRMASSLLAAGHEVCVWNRTRERAEALAEKGAMIADTPALAVADCEVALSMVRDDEASRQVWLDPDSGALAAMPRNAVAIESATLTYDAVLALGGAFRARGVAFLDAPVAGSRPQADAGELIFLIGGEADVVARMAPILSVMGGKQLHAGGTGAGAMLKLAVNAMFGVQVALMGELIGMFARSDVDVIKLVELLSATPVCSPGAANAAKGMLAGNFAPQFPIALVAKDFEYVRATAAERGAPAPLATATAKVYAEAAAAGYGEDNITGIVQVFSPK